MILTGKQIREAGIIEPYSPRTVFHGTSYGESYAGYDIRLGQVITLTPGQTVLGVSLEHFNMPPDVLAVVHDKSTWARRGVSVNNTVLEPGWRGYLTLEISYLPVFTDPLGTLLVIAGMPIAQVVFHRLEHAVEGYRGKYQDQVARPIGALLEEEKA